MDRDSRTGTPPAGADAIEAHAKPLEGELQQVKPAPADGSFLTEVSAALRAPLDRLIGMTGLALETTLTSRQREYLEGIRAAADSLLLVANNLLDLSQIEAGTLSVDAMPFNLRDSLGYTLGTLALRARANGLELVYRVLDDVPEVLVGDPEALRQIVVNLIEHAMLVGRRNVVVLHVEPEWQTADQVHLRCSVTESGNPRASAPSQPLPETLGHTGGSQEEGGCFGLNLLTASRIAEVVGGRLRTTSQAGEGCAVHVSLQFERQRTPMKAPVPAPPSSLNGLPILVVDPDAATRQTLQAMLIHWGSEPVAVDSTQSALAFLEQGCQAGKPFRLVILDLSRSQAEGFALIEQIRRHPRVGQIRLVVLTASGRRGDAARCRTLGVAAYLTRPMRTSELFDALMTVLGTTEGEAGASVLVTRHWLREHRRAVRVLLIAGDRVAQRLVSRVLEKRGHTVLVVNDSGEASAVVRQQPVDILLVDLTSADEDLARVMTELRNQIAASGLPVRLLGITDDPEREPPGVGTPALWDGWVCAPWQASELVALVERTIQPPAALPSEAPLEPFASELLNRADLLERVEGDLSLLGEMAGLFDQEAQQLMAEIREGVTRGDPALVTRGAQRLHATLRLFSAEAASEAALQLAAMGRRGDLSGAEQLSATLEDELAYLKSLLTAMGKRGLR